MKMGDHFALPVQWYDWRLVGMQEGDQDKAATHAINCHDDLVATLEAVRQEIIASALLGQRNAAGLLTDSALWAGRAVDRIDAILNKAKG